MPPPGLHLKPRLTPTLHDVNTADQEHFIYYFAVVKDMGTAPLLRLSNTYFAANMSTLSMIYAIFVVKGLRNYAAEDVASMARREWADLGMLGIPPLRRLGE
jgi:hypothetical protein